MGTPIGDLLVKEEIEHEDLRGKRIAIDGYNALYQFLSIIRQPDGTPLMDRKGRITSHLSGLFYRTLRFLEHGIKPVYVFDGRPPELKEREIERRKRTREEMEEKWREAVERGEIEEARKYAQGALRLTEEMVEEAKRLLDLMGIPYVNAPSEGEAQAAYMARKGDVYASGSQDYDSLLFGTPVLIRNLAITGKRKLPGKNVYVTVKVERIVLEENLRRLGIDRRKLIWIGMLLGTDYNEKVPGVGPKKALELVKAYDSFEHILKVLGYRPEWDWEEVERIFLEPEVTDEYSLEWKRMDVEGIMRFLCGEHDFSEERVRNALSKVSPEETVSEQTSLDAWF